MDWFKMQSPDPDSQFISINAYGTGNVSFQHDLASRTDGDKLWSKTDVLK